MSDAGHCRISVSLKAMFCVYMPLREGGDREEEGETEGRGGEREKGGKEVERVEGEVR